MDYSPTTKPVHTPAWIAQAWIAFGLSVSSGVIGIYYLDVGAWPRAFLAITFLMTVSSSFTLAKTVRDSHEATTLIKRIDDAKVERLLSS